MTKVVCWNMRYKRDSWRMLVQMGADVALLQETCRPPSDVADLVETRPSDHQDSRTWDPLLWDRDQNPARHNAYFRYRRWPRIAKLSDRVEVEWFTPVLPIDSVSDDRLTVSDVNTIAAARVVPREGGQDPFIVVSMYALWFSPHPVIGHRNAIMPDASAHRIISDLSAFVADADRVPHRILAAGDLNLDYGGDYGHRPLYDARCRGVWDRMAALGFEYLGPRYPNGRRADPAPAHLPADTRNVPTYYSNRSSPADAQTQLDHVFASRGFHETVKTSALNGVNEWGPSDHCRLLIEVMAHK